MSADTDQYPQPDPHLWAFEDGIEDGIDKDSDHRSDDPRPEQHLERTRGSRCRRSEGSDEGDPQEQPDQGEGKADSGEEGHMAQKWKIIFILFIHGRKKQVLLIQILKKNCLK